MIDFEDFPKVSFDTWKAKAEKDLKDKQIDDELNWSPEPGITLGAYYDASLKDEYQYITNFFSAIDFPKWKLYECITIESDSNANKKALEALENGCDGVIFELSKGSKHDLEVLLRGVLVDICDISFRGSEAMSLASKLKSGKVQGGLIFQNSDKKSIEGFRTLVVDSENPTPTDAIAEMVSKAIALLDEGYAASEIFFFTKSDKNFFVEIAKNRAIRFLMSAYLENQGRAEEIKDLFIYAEPKIGADYKSTMISNATIGLANVVSGVNAISFELGTDKAESFSKRIARNTGNLLREEAKLTFAKDPVAGNYFLDYLTHQYGSIAWDKING